GEWSVPSDRDRDEELAEGVLSGTGLLLIDLGCAIFAMGHIEGDGAPGGRRQPCDLPEQFARTPPQGHEGDARVIEAIEPFVGGKLGVEHQELWWTAVLLGPEVDEAEDLVGLLASADI